MSQQHFIIVLQDETGATVEFERWANRRLKTCIHKMIELYSGWGASLYENDLNKAAQVVAYETDYATTPDKIVWTATGDEFRRMVAEQKEQNRQRSAQRRAALAAAYEQEETA